MNTLPISSLLQIQLLILLFSAALPHTDAATTKSTQQLPSTLTGTFVEGSSSGIRDLSWLLDVPYGSVSLALSYDASDAFHSIYAMLTSSASSEQEHADFVGLQGETQLPNIRTVQLTSATGSLRIRAILVDGAQGRSPISFSWTTSCWSGMSSSGGSCTPPPYDCGPGSFFNSSQKCEPCPAGTFSATGRQNFCAPCAKDAFSSSAGAASCSRSSRNATGQLDWNGAGLQNTADVRWAVRVENAEKVTLSLAYNLEAGYDKVYVMTVEGGEETMRSGYSPGVQFSSLQGYMGIRIVADDTTTFPDPISFSWTAQCKAGYTIVGNVCRLPLQEVWVTCDAGQFVNGSAAACSPCPGGTYSEVGWVAHIFV